MLADILVVQVHRHTISGHIMHGIRADLNLYKPVVLAKDGSMQRPVSIGLRVGNKIFDATVFWLPQAMHMAQRHIAIRRRFHENAESNQIMNLAEIGSSFEVLQSLDIARMAPQFLIETIKVLNTPGYLGLQAKLCHLVTQN